MKYYMQCCICGKAIVNVMLDGNNPDPLTDEEGKLLSLGPNTLCCKHCNDVFVVPYRICAHYGLKAQCSEITKGVLARRSLWLKEK